MDTDGDGIINFIGKFDGSSPSRNFTYSSGGTYGAKCWVSTDSFKFPKNPGESMTGSSFSSVAALVDTNSACVKDVKVTTTTSHNYCGDGVINAPGEECDLGGAADWGSCSKATCQIQPICTPTIRSFPITYWDETHTVL